MLRSQFEEDLEKLHNQFYAMGQEVLSQINRTVRAFVTHDRDLAKEVIEDDAEVNEYEVKLEKKSFEMISFPNLSIKFYFSIRTSVFILFYALYLSNFNQS